MSKRPNVNAVMSVGVGESDAMTRTGVEVFAATAVSVMKSSARCTAPRDAEEETVLRTCSNAPILHLTS